MSMAGASSTSRTAAKARTAARPSSCTSPMREADLPPERIEHGYDNRDFPWAGVTFGERCVVRAQLPDYPIRRIRTGQFVHVREELRLRNLWKGEADIGG